MRRKEQRQWSIQVKDVSLGLGESQLDQYRQVLGMLSSYGSHAFAAPALLRTCTFTHPDPGKRDSCLADVGLDDLLQGSAKLKWLLKFLIDVFADPNERVIIFADSHYSRRILYIFFEYVVGNCDVNGERDQRLRPLDAALFAASVPTIAGTTPPAEVERALAQFTLTSSSQRPGCPVLIATSMSGGRGHNAPCVRRVVFFDIPPSSRAWWQCIYRGLRPPRCVDETLYVRNLVVRHTIEEGYHQARWARAALSDALLPGGDPGAGQATNEDVLCAQRQMLDK